MKRMISAQNDGNGKQKKTRPSPSGLKMIAFNQHQQLEKEEIRSIQGSRGLDVAVLEGGDSLKKRKRSAQNDGDGKQKESSAFKQQQVERQHLLRKENRRIKERCKRKRSVQNDGDGKQKESSASKQQQVERQQLLREENRRIRKRRGFDFGDIPPIGPIGDRLYEPCWVEKSLYPASKVYEDMAKIGLKSYNREYDTSYQFTKILRVYFFKTRDNCIDNLIFFQAEDKSVASPEDFLLIVASVPGVTVVSSCMKEKDIRYYTALDGWRSCDVCEYYVLGDHT
ncbi:uncharacterized protein LOC131331489 isoform X2 [Rhododendron vialii]|uniref:uncharacterized protein LOC131331489 isoform X2 n=1 Tax=Rhododendron vialii TaxID=182163 RepID=UPI00265D841A|nr:uncharacterized protein LOC131331489 isoform X2 [Rhododendron vialii]